jgi:hypothetical protein
VRYKIRYGEGMEDNARASTQEMVDPHTESHPIFPDTACRRRGSCTVNSVAFDQLRDRNATLRDVYAACQHVTLVAPNYQMAGQAFLDLDMRATVLMFMDDRSPEQMSQVGHGEIQ